MLVRRSPFRVFLLIGGLLLLAWSLTQTEWQVFEKQEGAPDQGRVTQAVPAGSILSLRVSGTNHRVDVRVVGSAGREVTATANGTSDYNLAAQGEGRDVALTSVAGSPAQYYITVGPPAGSNYTAGDLAYKLEYTIWKPDYGLMFVGLFFMAVPLTIGVVERRREDMSFVAREATRRQEAPPKPAFEDADEDNPLIPRSLPPPFSAPPSPRPAAAPQLPTLPPPPPVPETPAAAPEPAPPAAAVPIAKVKCATCGTVIPIYSRERPLPIACPGCGRKGMLK